MSTEALSCRAPLAEYQQQAEAVFAALQSGDDAAQWRFKWMHPRFRGKSVAEVKSAALDMSDAQLLIAREHYFENWAALSEFTQAIHSNGPVDRFEKAVDAVVSGDVVTLRTLLQAQPELVHARSTRFHHATLLHYLGANGVENYRQKTPDNAVEVAKLLLEAGAKPDALADLYDHQCTTMSMLVSSCHPHEAGLQVALAETLLDHGAAFDGAGTNWQSAVMTSLTFGYTKTAEALVRRGAPIDNLVVAAGLGRMKEATDFLNTADSQSRHQALALAAQLGQTKILKLLLDAGEDPNRFNPEGFHSHSTPLHQAVWADHLEAVKLLAENGARLDIRDTLYDGTPLDWAKHGKREGMVGYLQKQVDS